MKTIELAAGDASVNQGMTAVGYPISEAERDCKAI
jgi:hypothetical protein